MSKAVPETTAKKQRSQGFKPGQSGNPAGRPKGSRNKAVLALEALLDGEAEELTRKAIEMAMSGDSTAMRLVIDRLIPPRRERPIMFEMPKLETASDAIKAMGAVVGAVAAGDLTPGEAGEMAKLVENFTNALKVEDLQKRVDAIEAALGASQ